LFFSLGCPHSVSSWHGTHVAGIAGARGNNSSGIAGIAWDASILPVRVLGKCLGYLSDIIAGIRWAAGGACRVRLRTRRRPT
jgi:serine protease